MLKKTIVTVAALLAVSASAFAAGPAKLGPMDPAKIPVALKSPQFAEAMEVQKSFPGPSGLTGWVVKDLASGKQVVLFSTSDQKHVMAGILMDKDGNNLSAAYAEQHIPKPDYNEAMKDISASGSFAIEGSPTAKAEITVFYDVNCGFCKIMHKMTKPAVDAGELRIRYLPVAILGADSSPKGAALLASKDLKKTFQAALGPAAEQSNDRNYLAKVAANTSLMKKHGFNGTPAVLYSTKVGNDTTTVVSNGLPTLSEMYKALGINGNLEKLKADPELARYVR